MAATKPNRTSGIAIALAASSISVVPRWSLPRIIGVLVVCSALIGQTPQAPDREALQWSAGVGERFQRFSSSIVSSYALGQLAAAVCKSDQPAGSGLFRKA